MMFLLDWRYLTFEQSLTMQHSPLIQIIVKGGMIHLFQTMKSCMKLALRFSQLT